MSRIGPAACVICCFLACPISGCSPGAATTAKAPPPALLQGVERFLPLQDEFVYQYDVAADNGESGRMMVHISRPRPGLAELDVAGKIQRLELSPDAVRHATGGFLLKGPLGVGAQWKGQFGQVSVVSITRSIQTPAGSFNDCVETVEEASVPTPKRATSVFCRDVGLVSLRIEGALDGDEASVSTLLRSYGPRATGFE
jgi:hypothetical protein